MAVVGQGYASALGDLRATLCALAMPDREPDDGQRLRELSKCGCAGLLGCVCCLQGLRQSLMSSAGRVHTGLM